MCITELHAGFVWGSINSIMTYNYIGFAQIHRSNCRYYRNYQ